jgi:hypothetical protein
MTEHAKLIERLEEAADQSGYYAQSLHKEAATALQEMQEEIERLNADIAYCDKNTEALEDLLEPHIQWDGTPESIDWKAQAEAAETRIKELEGMLFPYANDRQISGMSWGGFYLIGNEKSIDELRRIENRSAQIEVFSKAYDESKKALTAERDTAEANVKQLEADLKGALDLANSFEDERDEARIRVTKLETDIDRFMAEFISLKELSETRRARSILNDSKEGEE